MYVHIYTDVKERGNDIKPAISSKPASVTTVLSILR